MIQEALALSAELRNNRAKARNDYSRRVKLEMVMKNWTGIVLCAGLLAGCTSTDDRILFDGHYYNAKLRKVERQLDQFIVTVKPVSKSLVGAREAGRYEAVTHCVNLFGSSDIVWSAGPDALEGQLNIEKDVLTLAGKCPSSR